MNETEIILGGCIGLLAMLIIIVSYRKNRSASEDIPPLLSDKLRRDDYYITKTGDRARRDTYEIPGTYEADFKKLPTQRLPPRTVKFKAGVDYPTRARAHEQER